MRRLEELQTTSNSSVYKKLLKSLRETEEKISCSRCPYHRVENMKRTPIRSWKWRTRRRRQYSIKEMT